MCVLCRKSEKADRGQPKSAQNDSRRVFKQTSNTQACRSSSDFTDPLCFNAPSRSISSDPCSLGITAMMSIHIVSDYDLCVYVWGGVLIITILYPYYKSCGHYIFNTCVHRVFGVLLDGPVVLVFVYQLDSSFRECAICSHKY